MPRGYFDWTFLTKMGIGQTEVTGGAPAKAGEVYTVPRIVVDRLADALLPLGFDLDKEITAAAYADNRDAFRFDQ